MSGKQNEQAQFGEVLKKLPQGIDTYLAWEFDENGFVCSGGKAQKVAIARLFAKKERMRIVSICLRMEKLLSRERIRNSWRCMGSMRRCFSVRQSIIRKMWRSFIEKNQPPDPTETFSLPYRSQNR